MIKLGKHGMYVPDEALPPYLHNRNYLVKYNPLDMNSIDLYNIDALRIGDFILEPGKLVATLNSMENKGNTEKQALVSKVRKQHHKAVRAVSQTTIDLALIEDPERAGLVSTDNNGLMDTRKMLTRRAQSLLEDETKKLIKADIGNVNIEADEEEAVASPLTYKEDESILTYGDD